jgi:two-component system cell cycle sensor histidine kinase/response regulator CckA
MDTHAPLSSAGTKTILVVDDDPSTMLICVKTLRAEGFTVLEAEGSSEALKILATHQEPIDLLLTDLMLTPPGFEFAADKNPYPRVHGQDVIQRTLAMKKTFRMILMSSLSYHERKAHNIVTDHVPFLQKPFSVKALIELVHTVLAAAPLTYDDSASKSTAKQDVRWYG